MADTRTGPVTFRVVVIAASAGGIHALRVLLSALPGDFAAPIVVVQHLDRRHDSLLSDILGHHTALRVKQAEHGDRLRRGCVYVAPPDHHLLVEPGGVLTLNRSELVNFVRPSADLLFESVAASCRERAIGVVLTGTGRDGAQGIAAIAQMGGTAIVQDPTTAEHGGMPTAAVETGCVDRVEPLENIAAALLAVVGQGR